MRLAGTEVSCEAREDRSSLLEATDDGLLLLAGQGLVPGVVAVVLDAVDTLEAAGVPVELAGRAGVHTARARAG